MRIRVIKPFAGYSVGTVVPEMPGGQARNLIGRGLVEEAKDEVQAKKSAGFTSPADRSIRSNQMQLKRR